MQGKSSVSTVSMKMPNDPVQAVFSGGQTRKEAKVGKTLSIRKSVESPWGVFQRSSPGTQ